jgi:hypothetical protein
LQSIQNLYTEFDWISRPSDDIGGYGISIDCLVSPKYVSSVGIFAFLWSNKFRIKDQSLNDK